VDEWHPDLARREGERAVGLRVDSNPELHANGAAWIQAGAVRHFHEVIEAIKLQRARDAVPQRSNLHAGCGIGREAEPSAHLGLERRHIEIVGVVVEWIGAQVQRGQAGE